MNFGKSTAEKVADEISKRGNQAVNGIENAVESANDVAQHALSNVGEKMDRLEGQVKPAFDRMVARGEAMANDVITGTRDAGERGKQAVSRYTAACESYVAEQPMKSVAIAAAAGAALAAVVLMLSRNRANKCNSNNAR